MKKSIVSKKLMSSLVITALVLSLGLGILSGGVGADSVSADDRSQLLQFSKPGPQPLPPPVPTVTGPTEGEVGVEYTFCAVAIFGCPWVDYQFDWDACGSHDYSDWYDNNGNHYGSGVPCCVPHSWGLPGTYCVKARSRPPCGHISPWSDPHYITITGENEPPDTPDITGPTSGTAGEEYEYTFVTTDPNGDDVYYYIGWGDNQTEEWIGPHESDEEVTVRHTWDEEGTYTIKAKAKDIYNAESDWGTLEVAMPVNQQSGNSQLLFPQILERLYERFLLLEQIFLPLNLAK